CTHRPERRGGRRGAVWRTHFWAVPCHRMREMWHATAQNGAAIAGPHRPSFVAPPTSPCIQQKARKPQQLPGLALNQQLAVVVHHELQRSRALTTWHDL